MALTDSQINRGHIIQFYEFDKTQPLRLAPKVTDNHTNLKPFSTCV